MATCEVCGETGTVTTVTIASTQVKACQDCVDNSTETQHQDAATRRQDTAPDGQQPGSRPGPDAALAPDYGDRVRTARETQGLSQEALADRLNLKQSVLRRVENKELTPDRELAQTLEHRLDISLYAAENTGTADTAERGTSGGAATLGDVADIKTGD